MFIKLSGHECPTSYACSLSKASSDGTSLTRASSQFLDSCCRPKENARDCVEVVTCDHDDGLVIDGPGGRTLSLEHELHVLNELLAEIFVAKEKRGINMSLLEVITTRANMLDAGQLAAEVTNVQVGVDVDVCRWAKNRWVIVVVPRGG